MTGPGPFDVLIVGGFGHVGLPFGIALADAGVQVALYDRDQRSRPVIESGHMPFVEYDAEPPLRRTLGRTLHIADDIRAAAAATCVVVTIGTPLDAHQNPALLPILDVAGELLPHLRPGHHVILRSTVYPGTSRRVNEFYASRRARVHLAFCPERVVQGYAVRELGKLPQIVAGFTEPAVAHAHALFRRLGVETVEVTVQEAELAKLFSNAWRYIQFAIANQFYMIATESGADFERVHRAMTYGYDRAHEFPKPGFAAGPCLLKDTLQLSAFHRGNFMLGQAAMLINEGLPSFIVDTLRHDARVDFARMRVGVLGMAFKGDVDDVRDSLSFKLVKILRFHGAFVVCSDEFVGDPSYVGKEEILATCPVVIVAVPHSAYRQLTIPSGVEVIDLWGVVRPTEKADVAHHLAEHPSEAPSALSRR
jgi:UDP-N-acetyl-D-mannosaminuronic acid dehydrogenase